MMHHYIANEKIPQPENLRTRERFFAPPLIKSVKSETQKCYKEQISYYMFHAQLINIILLCHCISV